MRSNNTFSIGELSKLTGVTKRQLRHWELAGYLPAPMRITYGERSYRRFSRGDMALVRAIKANLDHGYTLKVSVARAIQRIRRSS